MPPSDFFRWRWTDRWISYAGFKYFSRVLIAIALVAFILIQKGQGATAGAAFGSGASGTVFGARGAGNFLSRTTWVLAALFCTISLTMAVIVSRMSAAPEDDLESLLVQAK